MRFDLHFVADDVFCVNYHPFTREPIAFRLELKRHASSFVLRTLRERVSHAVGPVRGDTLIIHAFTWNPGDQLKLNYPSREYVFTDTPTGMDWFRQDFLPLVK